VYCFNDQNPDDNFSDPVTVNVFNHNSTLVEVGPNSGWSPIPLYMSSRYSYSQMIYLDSELPEAGFIDFIGFVYDFASEVIDSRIKVYLGETTLDFFTEDFVAHDELTPVFDGYVSFQSGEHKGYLMLDEPYYYDGGNLLVAIVREYNWHNTTGMRRFNGGFIDTERSMAVQSHQPIDPDNPGFTYPNPFQVRVNFVFNSSGRGHLSGNITDSLDNSLTNTMISIAGGYKTALTDTDGSFIIQDIYAGQYDVKVSKPGYVQQTISNVTVDEYLTTDLTASLSNSPADNEPPDNVVVETYQRNNVLITWNEPQLRSNRDLLGYYVYRDDIRLHDNPLTDYEFHDRYLQQGSYEYFVTAFYSDGESIESEVIVIDVNDYFVPQIIDIQLIEDESGLLIMWDIIQRNSGNREELLRDLSGFNLYRNDQQINIEPIPVDFPLQYADHDVENLVNYQYTVTAIYDDGESDHSLPWEFFTMFPPHSGYGLPWGDYIELHWSAPPEPSGNGYFVGYNVYDLMMGDLLLTPEPITDEFFIIDNVASGEQYSYYIKAVYNIGESVRSNIISVTAGESGVNPPQDLSGSVDISDVTLTWTRPQDTGSWLNWDNEETGDDFGLLQGEEFIAAVRFDQWDLMAYDHYRINEIAFLANNITADYSLIIWRKDLWDPDSEMYVAHQQEITDVEPDSWNFVRLEANHMLENNQNQYEFTIGIKYDNYTGNPAVYDTGSNDSPKGDLLIIDGDEQHLADYEIDANWKIRMYMYPLEQIIPVRVLNNTPDNLSITASSNIRQTASFNSMVSKRSERRVEPLQTNLLANVDLYLTGYNLYRDDTFIASIPHFFESYVDEDLADGSYTYYLTANYEIIGFGENIESDATQTITIIVDTVDVDDNINPLLVTRLIGNYPNPFNPETSIAFSLAENTRVRLEIFNIRGQKVKTLLDEEMAQGEHSVIWRGETDRGGNSGSGVYFYRMTTDDYTETGKMMLLK